MLVVSGSYQNYQSEAVHNQLGLADVGNGKDMLGVTVKEGVHCTLYTPQSNNVSTFYTYLQPLKMRSTNKM
jgi:hypothetical protein